VVFLHLFYNVFNQLVMIIVLSALIVPDCTMFLHTEDMMARPHHRLTMFYVVNRLMTQLVISV